MPRPMPLAPPPPPLTHSHFLLQVYFKQFCRKCQKEFNPYRVEDITCHVRLSYNMLLFLWCVSSSPN